MQIIVNLVKVFINPKNLFATIKKENDIKKILLYVFLISCMVYILYLTEIFLRFKKNDISSELSFFNILFNKFNIWVVIYLITLLLFIFLIVIVISLLSSIILKYILIIPKLEIKFIQIWNIVVYSLTPVVLWQALLVIFYILHINLGWLVIFLYLYIIMLIIIGVIKVKE